MPVHAPLPLSVQVLFDWKMNDEHADLLMECFPGGTLCDAVLVRGVDSLPPARTATAVMSSATPSTSARTSVVLQAWDQWRHGGVWPLRDVCGGGPAGAHA